MKKVVLIAALASQVPLLNAAPRACGCQRPTQPAPAQQPVSPQETVIKARNLAIRACGCQRPTQPAPVQQPLPAQADDVAAQPSDDVKMNNLIKDCCAMLMDEAQKLNNSCLADEIVEVVHMAEVKDMQKCPCNKPQQQPTPQPQTQAQAEHVVNAVDASSDDDLQAIPAKALLEECCLALLDEAAHNCDEATFDRVEEILEKVEMIPCSAE